tara:strand:- start:1004 stop:1522 length:519 start_codon:yes stop_codon:yes gene_type:complete
MATPFVKAAIMAVGAVVSAVSSFRQADATEDLAALEAQREAAAADAEAAQRARDAEDLQKRQIAAFSASGVRSGAGTPLLIQADTIKQSQEDIFNIRQNSLFAQASLKGRGSIGASKLRSEGTSTLLTAGSKIADMDFGSKLGSVPTTSKAGGFGMDVRFPGSNTARGNIPR